MFTKPSMNYFREIEHSLPKCEVWVYVQAAQL